jgi:hypothetical protein
MNFFRINDNNLYLVDSNIKKLGFSNKENLRIPDEYLENNSFVVCRTCHGFGDWGILSAMPRLLKQKYPDSKVYVPSSNFIKKIFNVNSNSSEIIFKHNPYVDDIKDYFIGEVFHDHYRVYDENNHDIPLVEQILKFWQFEDEELIDSQPEMYWSEEEQKIGDDIIDEYIGDKDFGVLLISDRYGTQKGKFDKDTEKNERNKITKFLYENELPYFYWTYKPIEDTNFNFINKALNLKNINIRIQLYIKSKAKVNIGNQCGMNHMVVRYSDVYEIQRQFPLGHNFIKGEHYL